MAPRLTEALAMLAFAPGFRQGLGGLGISCQLGSMGRNHAETQQNVIGPTKCSDPICCRPQTPRRTQRMSTRLFGTCSSVACKIWANTFSKGPLQPCSALNPYSAPARTHLFTNTWATVLELKLRRPNMNLWQT